MSTTPEFIRVIDTNGREHFIHPTTIADAHVAQGPGAQPHVEIVTTARSSNPNLGDRPQSVHVSGAHAEQLLGELRRRAGFSVTEEDAQPQRDELAGAAEGLARANQRLRRPSKWNIG